MEKPKQNFFVNATLFQALTHLTFTTLQSAVLLLPLKLEMWNAEELQEKFVQGLIEEQT